MGVHRCVLFNGQTYFAFFCLYYSSKVHDINEDTSIFCDVNKNNDAAISFIGAESVFISGDI